MFERETALCGAQLSEVRGTAARVRLGEARQWHLVQVAAFATTLSDLERTLRTELESDLPQRIGETVVAHRRHLLKTGPEQYWIISPESDDLPGALQAAVPPELGAVTLLSHSRTCIVVEGPAARELLATSIALDLHPSAFSVGAFALTGIHHTPVLVYRTAEDRYELFVMRTFALCVWDGLADSALEFE